MSISRLLSSRLLTAVVLTGGLLLGSSSSSVNADLKTTVSATQHVVSMNNNADWDLNAELNHSDGMYRIGDNLVLRFSSPAKDCYVHIFNLGPDGKINLIWPNEQHPENKVAMGASVQFPSPGSKLSFRARAPIGKEMILLLATERPMNLRDPEESRKLTEFLDSAKAKQQSALSQLRNFVIEKETPNGWAGKAIEITTQAAESGSEQAAKPQIYCSKTGSFTVKKVGEFKQVEMKPGLTTYLCDDGKMSYGISHFEAPELSTEQATVAMNQARENQKKDFGGTVIGEQSVALPEGFGYELQIKHQLKEKDQVPNLITLLRTLRIGNRIYVISVSATETSFCQSSADAFMQSFQVTKRDTQVTGI